MDLIVNIAPFRVMVLPFRNQGYLGHEAECLYKVVEEE